MGCVRDLGKLADIFAKPLFIVFEKSWMSDKVPDDWKKGNSFPIFKRKEKKIQGTLLCAWEDCGTDPPERYIKAHKRRA